jgi:hypothetical protein
VRALPPFLSRVVFTLSTLLLALLPFPISPGSASFPRASASCRVCEMSDENAYMALALNNAQGELDTLEQVVGSLPRKCRDGRRPVG